METRDDAVCPGRMPFGPGWEEYAAARARFLQSLGLAATARRDRTEEGRLPVSDADEPTDRWLASRGGSSPPARSPLI